MFLFFLLVFSSLTAALWRKPGFLCAVLILYAPVSPNWMGLRRTAAFFPLSSWRSPSILHSLGDRNADSGNGGPSFPLSLYRHHLKAHMTSSISSSTTETLDVLLVQQLVQCLSNDSRCPLYLGSLYFQGLVPRGAVPQSFEQKNITRALSLWHQAARMGNPDAQFLLSNVYSLFFNPPAFLEDPERLLREWDRREGVSLNASASLTGDVGFSGIKPIDVDRLLATMRVLDVSLTKNALKEEHALAKDLLSQIRIALKKDPPMSPSKAAALQMLAERLSDDQLKRFPLYRRESLAILYLYAAAVGGHVGAQLALGFRHLHGLGVPKRCHAASAYYIKVARDVAEVSSEGILKAPTNIRLSLQGLAAARSARGEQQLATISAELKSHYLDLQFHVAESGGDPRIQTAVGKLHLFGLEDLPQNFEKAFYYFQLAARSGHREAMAYLGYLYALGLGVKSPNSDFAFKLFTYAASNPQDTLAHNGLGYLYFKGTDKVAPNLSKAVYHFNISATRGFPDAQYNLGTLYFSGAGVPHSFARGLHWLARALEQGHSGAGFLMGLMHLNGLGTLRDCTLAVNLFKRVAEKHPWVTQRAQKAPMLHRQKRKDEAAFVYWSLAEAGHEVSQSNLGMLLDGGGTQLLAHDESYTMGYLGTFRRWVAHIPILNHRLYKPTALFSLDHHPSIGVNRAFAQRYWELSALQSSAQGGTRLGDYAYYGWGVISADSSMNVDAFRLLADFDTTDIPITVPEQSHFTHSSGSTTSGNRSEAFNNKELFLDASGDMMSGWAQPRTYLASCFVTRHTPDYKRAFQLYETASEFPGGSVWSNTYLAQAEYAMGRLQQYGAGAPQDLHIARRRYSRYANFHAVVSKTSGDSNLLAPSRTRHLYTLRIPHYAVLGLVVGFGTDRN